MEPGRFCILRPVRSGAYTVCEVIQVDQVGLKHDVYDAEANRLVEVISINQGDSSGPFNPIYAPLSP